MINCINVYPKILLGDIERHNCSNIDARNPSAKSTKSKRRVREDIPKCGKYMHLEYTQTGIVIPHSHTLIRVTGKIAFAMYLTLFLASN